jgi:hypothetical protein
MAPLLDTPRNRALAQRLADLTGQTPEQAAEQALSEKLERAIPATNERKERINLFMEERRLHLAAHPPTYDDRTDEELLDYDDWGLPT